MPSAYLDDILIASNSIEEHHLHVQAVFEHLTQNRININPPKCIYGITSIDFLGHHMTSSGITFYPENVAAIRLFPIPTSRTQIRRFIGMINFYRRDIPNCATLLSPLTDPLPGSEKNITLRP